MMHRRKGDRRSMIRTDGPVRRRVARWLIRNEPGVTWAVLVLGLVVAML